MNIAAPITHTADTSTLYKDGKLHMQWVKTRYDREKARIAQEAAVNAMCEDIPRLEPIKAGEAGNPDLCNLFVLTDCHVGLYAWKREGGQNWDIDIAEKTLWSVYEQLVAGSPSAGTAVIAQLGDFLHFDGLEAVTPTSGNLLDADGRFGKVVEVAIRLLRRVIDLALATHDNVHVVMAEGNHDLASSVWLRKLFAALYEREPRVSINDSELPFYSYRHGSTMLAFHHGHKKKNQELPLLFAASEPAMWGATAHRYCHTGHRHHSEAKDFGGMTVVQHPTLAARDAYASRSGYIAERHARRITYHSDFGEKGSDVVTPEMVSVGEQ
ncbi:hypothetical protein [Carnimonas bestiolae]|uniref:hypothetical protein n=1 Tax=Carnimonas bestiolae TaxID=3402172 RepID=UPI003F4AA34F